jgi:acylphosphatase
MSPDSTPFEKLLVALVCGKVDFVTIGGVACALNGFVRTTEDVDLLVAGDPENIQRLLAVLQNVGQGFARELSPSDFSDEEGAIRVIEEFPIDIFIRIGGRHIEDIHAHVRYSQIQGIPVPYLSAEGLILLKKESVRDKDQIDVAALRRISIQRNL